MNKRKEEIMLLAMINFQVDGAILRNKTCINDNKNIQVKPIGRCEKF